MTDRAAREAQGRRGETLAAWYLRLMGWRILAQRFRTPRGEIDLIARRGKVVAFVEVKWRSNTAALAEAIDLYRLRRVAAAAQIAYARYAGPQDTARIDVILIAPWCWPRRIANVWQPSG
ncbi:MAG: hypothetical protein RIQ99_1350 [Pseudomonadota bacterium]|jgi:putative endonuclease